MKDIQFYNEIESIRKYNDEVESKYLDTWLGSKKKIGAMIKELDIQRLAHNTLTKEEKKEADHSWKIEMLRIAIATRLGLYTADTMDCFRDSVNERFMAIDELKSEIKEMRSILKRHNHDYAGTYTSPARWVI